MKTKAVNERDLYAVLGHVSAFDRHKDGTITALIKVRLNDGSERNIFLKRVKPAKTLVFPK